MQLDKYDIEAIAKARVSRAENKKTTMWFVIAFALALVGAFLSRYSPAGGWGLMGLGVISLFIYTNGYTKKQNAMKKQLMEEWQNKGV